VKQSENAATLAQPGLKESGQQVRKTRSAVISICNRSGLRSSNPQEKL